MKRTSLFFLLFLFAFLSAQSSNLTTAQIAQLAKSKTISDISSLAISNGYKPAYKKNKADGYEGYNVTDIAWAYNATYVPSINVWEYSGYFSAIKLLYNNRTKRPETMVFVVSDGSYFQRIKSQITSYGYTLYNEDTTASYDAIEYCYYNDSLKIHAIFKEYHTVDNGYEIHFLYE